MSSRTKSPPAADEPKGGGSQTLQRGLDMLDYVVDGPMALQALADAMQLSRATTHRLASTLVERGFLTFIPRSGYKLGPKLLQLGFLAQSRTDIVQIARPHLEALATETEDTVHLGRLDGDSALYLDKIPGRRRIDISSRIGDRHPLTSTGLGKALILDQPEQAWQRLLERDTALGRNRVPEGLWLERMRRYVREDRAFDLEENEDQIRCVAAPVRDASGGIVAALSLSSAAQYMSDERMEALSENVRSTAQQISQELGWLPLGPGAAS